MHNDPIPNSDPQKAYTSHPWNTNEEYIISIERFAFEWVPEGDKVGGIIALKLCLKYNNI